MLARISAAEVENRAWMSLCVGALETTSSSNCIRVFTNSLPSRRNCRILHWDLGISFIPWMHREKAWIAIALCLLPCIYWESGYVCMCGYLGLLFRAVLFLHVFWKNVSRRYFLWGLTYLNLIIELKSSWNAPLCITTDCFFFLIEDGKWSYYFLFSTLCSLL